MRNWICGVLLCLSLPATSQDYFYDGYYYEPRMLVETGIRTGFMNSLTDIGRKPDNPKYFNEFSWNKLQPAYGLDIGLVFQRSIALRFSITKGMLTGADSSLKTGKAEASPRLSRNLHFKSSITEIGLKSEVHPLGILGRSSRISPYFLFGTGFLLYEPQAYLNGNWVKLRQLRSEGQGIIPEVKEYGKGTVFLSGGVGIYLDLSAGWSMRIEWEHRFLFTDYLDDVSTRFIDPAIVKGNLSAEQASNLQELYHLTRDYNGNSINLPGMIRGNREKMDAFAGLSLNFSRILNRRRI
jgi:hypothetical protein